MRKVSCLLWSVSLAVGAAAVAGDGLELWRDPVFQKTFLRSYGVHTDIEPSVTTGEREQMEKLLPLLGSNDLAAARLQLEKLAKPEASAVFDFTLGNIYFQQEDWPNAQAAYHRAVGKFPNFRRAWRNLGIIHVRRNEFAAAAKALANVVELGGSDAVTHGLLGHAYANTERFLAAELAFRNAMLLQPDSVDWRLGLARALFHQQKFAEAATLCEELLRQHPDRAEFWLLQANAWLGLKEPLKAAANYEILARMDKATAATQNTLGDIYVNEGAFDLAAAAYILALEQDADQASARGLRAAEILAARGASAPARAVLAKLKATATASLDDRHRMAMLKLESRLALAEGGGAEAATVLEEIVKLDPLDGEALLLLGQHYARAGQPERAVFCYERASNLERFEADAKVRHAQLLVAQSKLTEAVPLLRRAQEVKPRENVARYLEQVERLARLRR